MKIKQQEIHGVNDNAFYVKVGNTKKIIFLAYQKGILNYGASDERNGYEAFTGNITFRISPNSDGSDYKDITINVQKTHSSPVSVINALNYQWVDYKATTLYFDGSHYIDTGVTANNTIKFQVKVNTKKVTGGSIIGCLTNNETRAFRLFNYGNNFYLDYGSGDGYNRINGGSWNNNTWYELEVGNDYVKNLKTNSNIISHSARSSFSYSDVPIQLFKDDTNGRITGYIEYLKIWKDNKLVRNYIAINNQLYDQVNKKFYQLKSY